MFYELLAGMNDWDKQELYLQGAETYYYLNQVHPTLINTQTFPFLLLLVCTLPLNSYWTCCTFLSRGVVVS